MKRCLGTAFRWSWLLTLPVTLVFGWWLSATASRYSAFCLKQAAGFQLWHAGKMEFQGMLRHLQTWLAPRPGNLRTIELQVPVDNLARLDRDLPHSGATYVDGTLAVGDRRWDVDVRYRGDSAYHWAFDKKSFRVRTRRSDLFEGMRRFNLIAPRTPEILNNHLSYRLADRLGLIGPISEMVDVRVNGSHRGLFNLTEQLRELTLRRAGRMPGDLYSGDAVGLARYFGIDNMLFEHPGLWEKTAVNNHYPAESLAPIERLVHLVEARQTEEVQRQLIEMLDLEAFGRFHALEVLCSTVHVDAVHNWRLYYDANRGVFVPVVWDLMGWHYNARPGPEESARLDVISSPLHLVLHRNGEFLRARHRALREFFEGGIAEEFLAEVDETAERIAPSIEADPDLVVAAEVVFPGAAKNAVATLQADIRRLFGDIRKAYLEDLGEVRYAVRDSSTISLSVTGRPPVDLLQFEFDRDLDRPVEARVRYWQGDEVRTVDISGAVSVEGNRLDLATSLLGRFVPQVETMRSILVENNRMTVEPAYYELALQGLPAGATPGPLHVIRNGKRLPAQRVEAMERQAFSGFFAAVRPSPRRQIEVWEGVVEIAGRQVETGPVRIRPGTTVRMRPGSLLVFRSKVLAEGTAARPIRFLPATPGEPWGAVALQGRGASGSRFEHCEFAGGSGFKTDLLEYSGMLSVHDAEDVTLSSCEFRDNKVVDDAVHAVYAGIRLVGCEFRGALFDALDLDISRAVIEGCRFVGSGNDAIDLMQTDAVVVDTLLQGSGDKGISIGEASRLLALNVRFVDCAIGAQAKDRSVAVLCNCELTGNALALDCYDKNWRYEGGGRLFVYKSRLQDNRQQATTDERSAIWLRDSYVDRLQDLPAERCDRDGSVDADSPDRARNPDLPRLPAELEAMGDFGAAFWPMANPRTRGPR